MLRSKLSDLTRCGIPPFDFAGFHWPRHVATLERGTLRERMADRKSNPCGNYYHAPKPNARGRGFYLGSKGLRYRILDTGWYTNEYRDETINGLVFTLPKSRGFLAGWTMGEGLWSVLEPEIYETERDAERAADSLAENAADRQREDNERFEAMQLAEFDVENKTAELEKAFALRHRTKFGGVPRVLEAIEELRAAREALADATRAYEMGY